MFKVISEAVKRTRTWFSDTIFGYSIKCFTSESRSLQSNHIFSDSSCQMISLCSQFQCPLEDARTRLPGLKPTHRRANVPANQPSVSAESFLSVAPEICHILITSRCLLPGFPFILRNSIRAVLSSDVFFLVAVVPFSIKFITK